MEHNTRQFEAINPINIPEFTKDTTEVKQLKRTLQNEIVEIEDNLVELEKQKKEKQILGFEPQTS